MQFEVEIDTPSAFFRPGLVRLDERVGRADARDTAGRGGASA